MKGKISKFKHTVGTPFQLRDCYGDIRLGVCSPEANPITANTKFFAVPWATPGGTCIVPLEQKGAVNEETPLIINDVEEGDPNTNDLKFCPFNENMLVTGCQDGKARLWKIPDDNGLQASITTPEVTIAGHSKRLLLLEFNPLANIVLATTAADYEIKLWDVSTPETEKTTLPKVHKGLITSLAWNGDGSLLMTACKDKSLRAFDPRSDKIVAEGASHQGAKSSKALWLSQNFVCSIGFTKTNDRELHVLDFRNLNAKVSTVKIDNSTATPLPFWDEDNSLLYLGGKGEGTIKMFEVEDNGSVQTLSDFKSKEPATGLVKLPKIVCQAMKCEVSRFLKLTSAGQVIPIRFEVPRANMNIFQDDLFPDTWDRQATVSSAEWFAGKTNPPRRISMKP